MSRPGSKMWLKRGDELCAAEYQLGGRTMNGDGRKTSLRWHKGLRQHLGLTAEPESFLLSLYGLKIGRQVVNPELRAERVPATSQLINSAEPFRNI